MRGPSLRRGRVTTGMKCKHNPCAGNQAAGQTQCEETWVNVAADVQMCNIVPEGKEKPKYLECASWLVDVINFRSSITGQIDDRAWNLPLKEELAKGNEMGLDPSVGRRIRSQLENPHFSSLSAVLLPGRCYTVRVSWLIPACAGRRWWHARRLGR